MKHIKHITILLSIFLMIIAMPIQVLAVDAEVPVASQIQILLKMLESETRFANSKREIIVGVMFQADHKTSNQTKKDIMAFVANKNFTIGSSSVKFT
jgi:hypothetical protein